MEFYTYIWRDANGVPFYVGKGKGRRAMRVYDRSPQFVEIHQSGGCTVEVVDWFIHESQAHAHEVELIALYGRRDIGGLLVNKTEGGEGVSGLSPRQSTRDKISAALTGRCLSTHHRERISAGGRGVKRTEQTRAKMASSARNRTISHKEKLSLATAGIPKSESHREKLAQIGRMSPPSTGYKGVSFNVASGKWRAAIRVGGRRDYLGGFSEEVTAARVYDAAAVEAWGLGKCYLNFPEEHADAQSA